jgi:hypothetical protein
MRRQLIATLSLLLLCVSIVAAQELKKQHIIKKLHDVSGGY